MSSFRALREEIHDKQTRQEFHRAHLSGLSAWDRHKLYISNFVNRHNAAKQITAPTPEVLSGIRTDEDLLREHHEFVREDGGQAPPRASWEVRLACKYYQKLVKEFAICDLSKYKESKVGLRWRTEQEVVTGKGQFECGNRACHERAGLASFEVPFAYREKGLSKEALVKVRVCPSCAIKLNWKKEKQLRKLEKALHALSGKRKGAADDSDRSADKRPKAAAPGATLPSAYPARSQQEQVLHTSRRAQPSMPETAMLVGASKKLDSAPEQAEGEFWKGKPSADVTIEDEFDKYFDDMFA